MRQPRQPQRGEPRVAAGGFLYIGLRCRGSGGDPRIIGRRIRRRCWERTARRRQRSGDHSHRYQIPVKQSGQRPRHRCRETGDMGVSACAIPGSYSFDDPTRGGKPVPWSSAMSDRPLRRGRLRAAGPRRAETTAGACARPRTTKPNRDRRSTCRLVDQIYEDTHDEAL